MNIKNTKTAVGTKIIKFHPMTKQEYCDFRGWEVPNDEAPSDAGYLVEYTDGGKPNVEGFDGYVSWSPKDVFENSYREITGIPFGVAIEMLKQGHKMTRPSWAGQDMYVFYQKAYPDGIGINKNTAEAIGIEEGTLAVFHPYFMIKLTDHSFIPWFPNTDDLLAEDWTIVE